MAEAVISRAGGSGGGCLFSGMSMDQYNSLVKDQLMAAISNSKAGVSVFTSNTTFVANFTGKYNIFCVGGGGGGGGTGGMAYRSNNYTASGGGGGSGYTNFIQISLNKGQEVSVIVGAGGIQGDRNVESALGVSSGWKGGYGNTGGTSSFGSYISANGGDGGGGGGGKGYTQLPGKGGSGQNDGFLGFINLNGKTSDNDITVGNGAGGMGTGTSEGTTGSYGHGGSCGSNGNSGVVVVSW